MFKLFILSALLAVAIAQPVYIGSPYAPAPVVSSPYAFAPAYSAPVVKTALPVATSYANTYKLAVRNPYAPLGYAAPAFAAPALAAPALAAPAYAHPAYAASPLAYAHAPYTAAYSTGLGHTLIH